MTATTIFGPPGTGKTTRLINIVQEELDRGTAPDKIAFVSFSKKAAQEARDRATEKLGINEQQMIWFRTLHSFAFNQLGLNGQKVLKGADYNKIGELVWLADEIIRPRRTWMTASCSLLAWLSGIDTTP